MDIEVLKELIAQGKSLRDISSELGKSYTTVRYWLKKYELNTLYSVKLKETSTSRVCPNCKQDKSLEEFYNRRNKKGNSCYCKVCTNKQTLNRQRNLKKLAVEYKGGKCIKCGYNKYVGALEFHHVDPSKKDFTIGQKKNTSFHAFKDELDKCILVCANCHREIHGYQKGLISEDT